MTENGWIRITALRSGRLPGSAGENMFVGQMLPAEVVMEDDGHEDTVATLPGGQRICIDTTADCDCGVDYIVVGARLTRIP